MRCDHTFSFCIQTRDVIRKAWTTRKHKPTTTEIHIYCKKKTTSYSFLCVFVLKSQDISNSKAENKIGYQMIYRLKSTPYSPNQIKWDFFGQTYSYIQLY